MDGEVTSARSDEKANQRLRLLVGLVVVFSAITLGAALSFLSLTRRNLASGLLFAAIIALASLLRIRLRFGANYVVLSPLSAVALVCVTFLPAPWAILATAGGVFTVVFVKEKLPIKVGFNVGKEVLAVAAASQAAALAGMPPEMTGAHTSLTGRILGLAAASAAYAIIDEILSAFLFSLLMRMTVRQRLLIQLNTSLVGRLVSFLVVFAAMWAYSMWPWLIACLPFLVYAMHLASANQLRSRTERRAWQRLAQATDELNTVDLERIVETSVRRAATLLSADEVDLEIRLTSTQSRLVRGTSTGITFDGYATLAPETAGHVIPAAVDSGDSTEVARLRLRFRNPVSLSERESYTLRTLATAINTAIRHAMTFAETQRLAASHDRVTYEDPLTQLANRLRLQEYTADLLSKNQDTASPAMLVIDLNHFKEVNETLGHAAGDRLLVEVAERLRCAAGPNDLVARLGGDEFAILFAGPLPPSGAVRRALEVLSVLDLPVEIDGMSIGIEASGGVATPAVASGVEELLRRADVAMYQAKRKGQRIAAYSRSSDTASVGSLVLGGDLARAISERQFVLDYQPIVDLGSGEVIAAEALARWQHPEQGYLRPDQFLDGVERSGQLAAFAEVLLDQALTATKSWADAGFALDIAVNVSPRSLLDPTFPSMVAEGLARHDFPAASLVMELTESATISQNTLVDDVLGTLLATGVRLALDDFGTGFSSLSTVTRVPVYELKIDRSFVSDMESAAAGAVVRSTIELARSLGVLVVAEGVETEEQRRLLWELGCPAGQGYLFARPISTQRFLPRLGRGTGGRPGTLAMPIQTDGSVIRMATGRRARGDSYRFGRTS